MSPDGHLLFYSRAGSELPKKELRIYAGELRDRVASGRTFTCMLTDDRELERLNRMFLGRKYPTDVLSFPSGGGDRLGDIAISVQRAREQATEQGHSTYDEIRILMLHGLLHLLGMDHENDRGAMARAEKKWRRDLGLPAGLIERAKQGNKQ
jgi:probable rRNA maturation factor